MQQGSTSTGPIMRLFEVQTKPGCADELMRKFATTSAEVVRNKPGNEGYFFGQGASGDDVPRQHLSDRLSRLHKRWFLAHRNPEREHDDEQRQAPSGQR